MDAPKKTLADTADGPSEKESKFSEILDGLCRHLSHRLGGRDTRNVIIFAIT